MMSVELFRDFVPVAPVPEAVIDRYRPSVEPALVELWQAQGFGLAADGFLRVVNPDYYTSMIGEFLPRSDMIPVLATAMGDVVVSFDGKYRVLQFRYARATGGVGSSLDLIGLFAAQESWLNRFMDYAPYAEAAVTYGSLNTPRISITSMHTSFHCLQEVQKGRVPDPFPYFRAHRVHYAACGADSVCELIIDLFATASREPAHTFFSLFRPGDAQKVDARGCGLLLQALANKDLPSRYSLGHFLLDGAHPSRQVSAEQPFFTSSSVRSPTTSRRRAHRTTSDRCRRRYQRADENGRVPFLEVLNMKYSDEDLNPIYDLWFEREDADFTSVSVHGVSPISFAKKLPFRDSVVDRMESYVRAHSR